MRGMTGVVVGGGPGYGAGTGLDGIVSSEGGALVEAVSVRCRFAPPPPPRPPLPRPPRARLGSVGGFATSGGGGAPIVAPRACKPDSKCAHDSGPASTAAVMTLRAKAKRLLNILPLLATMASSVRFSSMDGGISSTGTSRVAVGKGRDTKHSTTGKCGWDGWTMGTWATKVGCFTNHCSWNKPMWKYTGIVPRCRTAK